MMNKHYTPDYGPYVRGIHWWPVDSPHQRPVMCKTYPCRKVMFVVYNVNLQKILHIDKLVQERHNSIANSLELCLSCTKPIDIWSSCMSNGGVNSVYLQQIKKCQIKTPTVCYVDYAWWLHLGVLWRSDGYPWLYLVDTISWWYIRQAAIEQEWK